MNVAPVEELLRTRIGLDPTAAGTGLVARAVRRRMQLLGLPRTQLDSYLQRLEGSEEESQELIEEVVVPESWFFRDEAPFRLLAGRATGRLAEPARPSFRVLSMPCAGGEEPYSALLSLVEAGISPERLRVDGVDLSHRALARAMLAVYTGNAFRTADLGFRDRYFRPVAEGYALDPGLARLVRFEHANLLGPGLLAGQAPYDAVFCRNLLIYLVPEARKRLLTNVDRLLALDGLLFVGHAEPPGMLDARFRPVGPKGAFAYERCPAPGVGVPSWPSWVSLPAPAPKSARPALNRPTSPRALPPARPSPQTGPVPIAFEPPRKVEPLAEAARRADEGRHDEAARLCEQDIATRGPTPQAYFLLGMVRQAEGDRARAQACFEKVVYLDGRHEDALLALALLAQRRGDQAAAANYRRRAGRAFQENQG